MDGDGEVTVEKTRIFVGGLGAGVTEDDLRKTFSALGEVVSVDVVRTKGRSFAYIDFVPSSDKSIPKLFSTYNGCMWKGGKLKLEKAKEHYLVKLKREWQEESERASKASDHSNADAAINHDTLEKPKKPTPADKTQFHLFFPKLGKVKSLAQVGIGKHKYSFQRIQVPTVLTHFCDCEEHSADFPPPNKKPSSEIDSESYGINEQELNIMNSVMNKIFARANPSKQVVNVSESTSGKDEGVAGETDEDNLIINVTNRKNDGMDLLGEMRAMMANQVQVPKKLNTSTKKPKSVNDTSQKEIVPLTKKRKSSHSEETSRNSRTRLDTPENNKTEVELFTKQSGNNSLRSLKSTWKDLLGQKRDTSFNISEFIASIPQRKEDEFNSDKNKKVEADGLGPGIEPEVGEATTENDIPDIVANDISDIVVNDCEQNEDELKADNLDLPLATVDQKEEEPKTDVLDSIVEQQENDQDFEEPNKDSHVKNDEDLIKTARGEFWRHKSSWTQLISTASHTSFSISHVIPNKDLEKHDQQTDTFDSQPPNKNLDDQILVVRKEAALPPVKKNIPDKKKLLPEAALPPVKNIPEKKKLLSHGKLESDETCSFMRTEESIKEWKKMKASLSGSLNKKKRLVNESA
ncbi:protein REPRESSOR OF SILENCING 3-like [Bidens hawaiensis]|uniref:protein REPRESSOR OF SILENCING 3-like n=1 Tax=Bidens hawaiensis TaxID=980011 RepID=UPI004049BDF8